MAAGRGSVASAFGRSGKVVGARVMKAGVMPSARVAAPRTAYARQRSVPASPTATAPASRNTDAPGLDVKHPSNSAHRRLLAVGVFGILLPWFALAAPGQSPAPAGRVNGRVTDGATGEAVPGAIV